MSDKPEVSSNVIANKWEREAAASNLRVFPIRISFEDGKWQKKPLIKNWQDAANFHQFTEFDWSNASGYGILMGNGTYALDLDDYKNSEAPRQWMKRFDVPWDTRTHETISGGIHKIYALPTEYKDLRTRANVVPGLDTRGHGGFIAFGEGYAMVDPRFPALLPREACAFLAEGADGAKLEGQRAAVEGYRPPTPEDAERRLNKILFHGPRAIRRRWRGDTSGMNDTSGSAMDHSLGRLLAMTGADEDFIVWILLTKFEHGSARYKANAYTATRAAVRSALKGKIEVQKEHEKLAGFKAPKVSDDDLDALGDEL